MPTTIVKIDFYENIWVIFTCSFYQIVLNENGTRDKPVLLYLAFSVCAFKGYNSRNLLANNISLSYLI